MKLNLLKLMFYPQVHTGSKLIPTPGKLYNYKANLEITKSSYMPSISIISVTVTVTPT